VDEANKGLFRTAGRSRDLPSEVFSPLKDSLVWPAALVFRWSPMKDKKLRLALQETGKQETLWEKRNIDSALGRYEDPEARSALLRWRNKIGEAGTGRLTFVLEDDEGSVKVRFDLLSVEAERDLERALARWDNESNGVLRLLGRANVLFEKELLPESLSAYEEALKLDPSDPQIRVRVIDAHRMIGDEPYEAPQ
jgi:hypothetical protein